MFCFIMKIWSKGLMKKMEMNYLTTFDGRIVHR